MSTQIGCPSHYGMLPMRVELAKTLDQQSVRTGSHEQVASWLDKGGIAMGPCSSIRLLKHPHFEMAVPYGISVKGSTPGAWIGYVGDQAELREVVAERIDHLIGIFNHANIQKTKNLAHAVRFIFSEADRMANNRPLVAPPLGFQSRMDSGTSLARVLYYLIFGVRAYEINERYQSRVSRLPGVLDLARGNDALLRRPQHRYILDLGEIWGRLTGLPFVFAVWQKNRKEVSPASRNRVVKAAGLASARMAVEPSSYLPEQIPLNSSGESIDLGTYWKNMKYKLGPAELRGLLLFLQIAGQVEQDLISREQMMAKLLRWQDRHMEAQIVH